MPEKVLFADSFLNQPSIVKRLKDEFIEASREFREDPKAYIQTAVKGDGLGGHRRKMLFRFGLAMGIAIYAIFFAVILVVWTYNAKHKVEAKEELELTAMVNLGDLEPQDVPDLKPSKQKAGGGGGGGREKPTPPSKGQPPPFSMREQIVAPTTRIPPTPPPLTVPVTLKGPEELNVKRDETLPMGDPKGVVGPPSDGPGTGGGIGSGSGGGVGSGDGRGLGPGRGMGTGGGDFSPGGSGAGPATAVDTKPIPLNRPRPNYTEEARKNKIQGIVRTRVLVGADGAVKQVRVSGGLPDGLNEEAIRAAYQMRFKPATKNGQPVAYWVTIEIEFNLR